MGEAAPQVMHLPTRSQAEGRRLQPPREDLDLRLDWGRWTP